MPKRLKFAYREHEIGLMYLAMTGRKRCGKCKTWILLTQEQCPKCGGTEFDMRREAPKDRRKLLRSKFYRNYLALRFGTIRGFRRGEITGQRLEDAICHCVTCRAWRLHKQGKTLEQVADAIHKGLKETEFKLDEAERYGEHTIQPLPGIRAEHFTFNAGNMEEKDDTGTVTETIPYGTLLVYGKGWARGRSKPEELRIFDPFRTEINDYIEANHLKGQDKLFPVKSRQFANIVKQAAVTAGLPHAEAMAPHGLRRSYATIAWRRLKDEAKKKNTTADPLMLQQMMRHADIKTTFGYIQLDTDERDALFRDIFSKPDQDKTPQKRNAEGGKKA